MTTRFLVVDDEQVVGDMLRTLLRQRGYAVEVALDGEAALERFVHGGIDIVLCDVLLPGMSGLEVLERVHDQDANVPVVLMTAYADKSKLTRAVRLDAFDFLEKPFDLEQVEVTCRRAVAQRELLLGRKKNRDLAVRVEELLRRLNASRDSAQLFDTFRERLPEALMLDHAALYARLGDTLELRSGHGTRRLELNEWPVSLVQCIESAEVTAIESGEGFGVGVSEPVGLFLPVRMEMQVWGVLLVVRDGSTFDDVDLRHFRLVVDHLASSIMVRERSEELERALRALEETQGRLVRTEKLASVTKLVAGMAHELKNPLTSMQFALANAEDEISGLPAEQVIGLRRFVELLGSDVQRLRERVDRFMALARPEAAAREHVEISVVLREVLKSLGPRAEAGGIVLNLVASDAPPIELDPVGLEGAVTNLVVNAIEACPAGGEQVHRVDVGVRTESPWVVVWVRDDGPGLSIDARERMFDVFFTTKARGAGLGLSQVHVFTETHGGDVRWSSQAGCTRFELWLPESVTRRVDDPRRPKIER